MFGSFISWSRASNKTLLMTSAGRGYLCGRLTQGGTRFGGIALGYDLSGFQPLELEPRYLGCYGCDSRSLAFISGSPFFAALW
jgi:hypothetical protein